MGGLGRLKLDVPEGLPDVVEGINIALSGARCGVEGYPISLEAVQELGNADSRRIDRIAALHFRNQAGAFDLGLPLGALERVPPSLALSGRVVCVEDDRIMTGRPFADVSFHLSSPSIDLRGQGASRSG